jgi:gamma-glutamylcyclotransferase (GGCT)/AIG2-like uncharacterized protein YtfP
MSKSENGADRGRKHYLFSYGTLLPRLAPAEIRPTVQRLRRVGKGFVRGQLFDLGEYPGAVLGRSGSPIAGQIFELPNDPEVLHRLDEYEGFDPSRPGASLFVRKRRYVQLEDGSRVFCWVYAYNRPVKAERAVSGGDYVKARSRRTRAARH